MNPVLYNNMYAPYLHSSQWTFFQNAANIGESMKNKVLLKTQRDKLEKYYTSALAIESQFYHDFGVASAAEWSNKYLLRAGNNTGLNWRQKLIEVINSNAHLNIFIKSYNKEGALKQIQQDFLNACTEAQIEEDIIHFDFNADSTDGLDEYLNQLLDVKTTTIKTGTRKQGNRPLSRAFSTYVSQNHPKTVEPSNRGTTANYYKKYLSEIKRNNRASLDVIINNSRTFLQQQMDIYITENKLPENTKKEIYAVINEWCNQLLQATDRDITNKSVIVGEFSDIGQQVIFNNMLVNNEDGESYFLKVYNNAREKLKTIKSINKTNNNAGVSSAVDNIYETTNGKKYYIQNKNSMLEIYEAFSDYKIMEQLNESLAYGGFRLAQDLSAETLIQRFEAAQEISNTDLAILSYLLVNIGVLSKTHLPGKASAHKNTSEGARGLTSTIIDQLVASNIRVFIADIFLDNSTMPQINDFFIIAHRALLPMSVVYKSIMDMIDMQERALLTIKTSVKSNYSQKQLAELEENKAAARQDDPNGENYSNANLVAIGQQGGADALSNSVYIKSVYLNFNVKNLMAKQIV